MTNNNQAFLAGAAVGAAASYYWFVLRCRSTSVAPSPADTTKPACIRNVLQDDILREHFTRNIQFFGEEAQQRLADSLIVVVGLGVCTEGGRCRMWLSYHCTHHCTHHFTMRHAHTRITHASPPSITGCGKSCSAHAAACRGGAPPSG